MSNHYRLEGHKVVKTDLMTWVKMFEKADRVVSKPKPRSLLNVFLGLDHQYGNGPPLLFETMVFGGPLERLLVIAK